MTSRFPCEDCDFEAKSEAGLAAHRHWKHSETPGQEPTSNVEALEQTLAALDLNEDRESARVQALRSLADAVDNDPGKAALWQQYREALETLLSTVDNEASEDILAEVRNS